MSDPDLAGEFTHEFVLLSISLEATVSVLGGCVDEFDIEFLGHPGLGAWEESLANDDWSLAGTDNATLDQEEVFVDGTVVREATHGSDVLLNGIIFAHGVVGGSGRSTGSNSVDLFVDLSSGVVTLLTTAGNRPLDGRRMPGSNTSDLTETSMRLTVKTRDTESLDGTNHSLTAGNTNGVDNLILVEDVTDLEFLLEFAISEVDLVSDGASVNLDLHDVGLALAELQLANLGGAESSHDSAVFLNAGKITGDGVLVAFSELVTFRVLGESLLFGGHPVLVHAPLDGFIEVGSPDGRESSETTGSLNITDKADNSHGWALNNSACVHDILLDHFLTLTTFLVLNDVGHASLVTHEGGETNWSGGIITGE